MVETAFYVCGIVLVLSAIAVALLGLRFEGFPPTRIALLGVVVYFAGLVGATTTFAVLNAARDQNQRESEQATENASQASTSAATTTTGSISPATTPGVSPTETTTSGGGAASGGPGGMVKLSADPNAIAYDTTKLSAKPGKVTVDFDNPSAVTHDVCLEGSGQSELGCSDTISQGNASLSVDLKPGSYTFYCSVDGHRQAGMEGTLTVK